MGNIKGVVSPKAFGNGAGSGSSSSDYTGAGAARTSFTTDLAIPANTLTTALSIDLAGSLGPLQQGDLIEWEFAFAQTGTAASFLTVRPTIGGNVVVGSIQGTYLGVAGTNKIVRGSMFCIALRKWRAFLESFSDPAGSGNDALARYVIGDAITSGPSDTAIVIGVNTADAAVSLQTLSGWLRVTRQAAG